MALLCIGIAFLVFAAVRQEGSAQPARVKRSAAARRAFRRLHPCPATGSVGGACPGYIIDHVKPLACGGADAPENMQWQTMEDAKAKDAVERKNCRGF